MLSLSQPLYIGDRNKKEIIQFLLSKKIPFIDLGELRAISQEKYEETQLAINEYLQKMPDLLPSQYYYFLAKNGMDQHIKEALDAVREIDLDLYATCKSQLNGARYFEWSKSYALYQLIKSFLININPELNYSDAVLKQQWLEAYKF